MIINKISINSLKATKQKKYCFVVADKNATKAEQKYNNK